MHNSIADEHKHGDESKSLKKKKSVLYYQTTKLLLWSGCQTSVESNQAITLVLILVLQWCVPGDTLEKLEFIRVQ